MTRSPLSVAKSLTTSFVASTYAPLTGGCPKHTLNFEWTPGTTANVLQVKVEYQATDGGEWTQLMQWDDTETAGTFTRTLNQLQHTATGTTVVPLEFTFERHAYAVRIKATESEAGSATKGTYTAWLTSSH